MTDRTRPGLRISTGIVALGFAAAFVPAVVVTALSWPRSSAPASPSPPAASTTEAMAPPAIDFDSIETLAKALKSSAPTTATTTTPTNAELHLAYDKARVEAERTLLHKIARARDARREAGGTLQDLRKPFSVEDLGGQKAMEELGIGAGKRMLIARPDLKVVAPAGASLPVVANGDVGSHERDEDVFESDATLDGKPVRIMRRCVAGELLCLLDIVPLDAPKAAATTTTTTHDDNNALVAAIEKERAKLAAWKPPVRETPATTAVTTSIVAPPIAALAGAIVALVLALLLASRARSISGALVSATQRLRTIAAGKPAASTNANVAGEIVDLERAIDDAARALGDGASRSESDRARVARLEHIALRLDEARGRIDRRIDKSEADELAVASVIASANALIESFEQRVLRWKSHVDVVTAPPAVSSIERRANALTPMAPAIADVSERVSRLAKISGMPQKLVDELTAIANVLAEQGKNAQTLVEQLVLDAQTDRKGDRPAAALDTLKHELVALSPQAPAPSTIAALADLPPDEIAKRLDEAARSPSSNG